MTRGKNLLTHLHCTVIELSYDQITNVELPTSFQINMSETTTVCLCLKWGQGMHSGGSGIERAA